MAPVNTTTGNIDVAIKQSLQQGGAFGSFSSSSGASSSVAPRRFTLADVPWYGWVAAGVALLLAFRRKG